MESSGTNQTDQNNAAAATSPFAPVDTPALDPMTMNMGTGSTAVQNGATGAAEATKPEAAKNEEAAAGAGTGETKTKGATGQKDAIAAQPAVDTIVAEVAAAAAPLSTDVTIEALLEECVKHDASDLHFQVGLPPMLRMDGVLILLTTYPILTDELVKKLVFATLDEDQQKILMKDKEFDYSFAFGDLGRFRVNAFHEKGNLAAAFRLIPNNIKSIDDLGIPAVVATFTELTAWLGLGDWSDGFW